MHHGIGTAIGAVAGFLAGGISALAGYKDEVDILCNSVSEAKKQSDEYIESIKKQKEVIQEKINTGLAEQDYYKNLVNELDNLVDKNGKVKSGYEDRVNFILNQLNGAYGTEYKVVDGIIQKYDELKENIYKLIDAKKAEIILNAKEEDYANAIKRQIENQHKKIEAQEKLNETTKKYDDKLKEIEENYGSLDNARKEALNGGWLFAYDAMKATEDLNQLEEAKNEAQSTYNNYTQAVKEDNETIILWEDLKTATITGNAEKIDEKVKAITNTYKTETGNQTATLQEQISKEIDFANDRKRVWEENGIEINQERENQLNIGVKTLADKLVEQTNTIEELTPDQINAWKTLAEGSEEIYNEKISQINPDTQLLLETIMNTTGKLSPIQIQKWADMAKNSKEQYERNLSGLDTTTSQRIQSCVDAINNKQWTAEQTAQGLADAVERGVNTIDTTYAGQQAVAGVTKGINQNKNNWSLWNAISGVVSNVKNWFNNMLGIHSPSRVFANLASYIPSGIAKGITDNIDVTTKPIKELTNNITDTFSNNIDVPDIAKELNQGIKINPKDFEIDTNQYINYSAIKGQILAQSQVNMNENIAEGIAEAVTKSLSNAEVNVNIEAKTEEGIIVNKIKKYEKEYKMRTGQPLFEY